MKTLQMDQSSISQPNLTAVGIKGGASPGAIMEDNDGARYVVKLGVPDSNGPYIISNEQDLETLTANMSRKSCEEKMFFNIAKAIGDGRYQLPDTELVYLKPNEYQRLQGLEDNINVRSVPLALRRKVKLNLNQGYNIEIVLNHINDTKIVHFVSKLIPDYQDIGKYYNYHEEKPSSFNHKKNIEDVIPEEPKGMGAFFALSCCVGNNDCIGAQGSNAGFNSETHQLIIVDVGNSNLNSNMVSLIIPSSDNHTNWLSYRDDLSNKSRKEACETFIRFASLSKEELRNLVTTEGKAAEVLGEKYIAEKISKLKEQQSKAVEIFYDEMIRTGCFIPEAVVKIKKNIEARQQKLNSVASGLKISANGSRENISPNIEESKRKSPEHRVGESKRSKLSDNINLPNDIIEGLEGVYQENVTRTFSRAVGTKKELSIKV